MSPPRDPSEDPPAGGNKRRGQAAMRLVKPAQGERRRARLENARMERMSARAAPAPDDELDAAPGGAPAPAPAEEDAATERRRRREANKARKARRAHKARTGTKRQAESAAPVIVRPLAPQARARKRHWGLLLAFVLMVCLPVGATATYLWRVAVDQYASTLGFTVRQEELASATDLLGGLGSALGGGGSSDSDILYEYIRSQELVAAVDARLDLRAIWSAPHEEDPILAFDPAGTIEDLVDYWQRMVRISYDTNSGLIELETLAFGPEQAEAIAEAIFAESSAMINGLSDQARADATRYAEADLARALERLKAAREAVTDFRLRTQIVDPVADIQGQMGLLNTLQAQLAAALIDLDLLITTTRDSDPRIEQARRRIDVIESRIEEERGRFGAGGQGPGGADYATVFAEFERLGVDLEFAETTYTAALTAYDAARAEADRQSRYLAAYINPTAAERADYPRRPVILALVALFGFLGWAIASLVFYSLRDRG